MSFAQSLSYYGQRFTLAQLAVLPVTFVILFFVRNYAQKKIVVLPKRGAVTKGDDLPHLAPLKCNFAARESRSGLI